MFKIYPYKVGSASVQALKASINAQVIRLTNSTYRPKDHHIVINWGNSRLPQWMTDDVPVLNHPQKVAVAGNKLSTLDLLEDAGVPVVDFTTDVRMAQDWLVEGHKVFVRHSLTGHSGEGIEVIDPGASESQRFAVQEAQRVLDEAGLEEASDSLDEVYNEVSEQIRDIPEAPLYTQGVANTGEYRVHVFDGEVILYQKKSRRVDDEGNVITAEGEQADVRNLASNWVYRTGNLRRLERVEELAQQAITVLGLDFGAVDIIKDREGNVFVLEVNTAPGLGNTDSLQAYADAINSLE